MKALPLITSLTLLAGCAADIEGRRNEVILSGAEAGFKPAITQTSTFKIFSLGKLTNTEAPIRVYIEGDGKAFLANGMSSTNPTPMQDTLLQLAFKDNSANILYLARPCQFVENDPACDERYWTTSRFAPETVRSISEVLQNYKNHPLEIIGFSGGAAIGLFLIPENHNITSFRSIAGNLDHKAFTSLHDNIPLAGSVDPDDYIKAASSTPQVHFIGADDEIVPAEVSESYRKKQPSQSCSKYYTIEGASHSSGWLEKWPELLKITPSCQ